MKTYRVSVLDFNRKRPCVVSQKYVKGLAEARALVPVKMRYCRAAHAFSGYDGKYEYWFMEV